VSLAVVYSRAQIGIESPSVAVEVHLANSLPSLSIVGLPEAAVKEAKDRVRAALLNAHFEFPARRITINLAPADLPKEGSRFDLPIAFGWRPICSTSRPFCMASAACRRPTLRACPPATRPQRPISPMCEASIARNRRSKLPRPVREKRYWPCVCQACCLP